jgi:hypothetical protein
LKLIIILTFLFSIEAYAEALTSGSDFYVDDRRVRSANEGDNNTSLVNGSGTSTSSNNNSSGAGKNLTATGGFEGTASGGLQNANQTQSSGNMTQILGIAMGVGFAKICPTFHGSWACAPAAMSFMDALAAGRAKNNAAYTGAFLDPNTGLPSYNPNGTADDEYNKQAYEGLSNLQNMGYSFTEDGSVISPNGDKITSADVGSVDALMKKGMTAAQAQSAMSQMKDIQTAAAQKAGMDPELMNGGGTKVATLNAGDGGEGTGVRAGADQYIEEIEYRGKANKNDGRMPASKAAEFSKNFNGTPIGIGMANLFLIVHKKYSEKKDKQTEFINREY